MSEACNQPGVCSRNKDHRGPHGGFRARAALAQPEPLDRLRLAEAIADHGDICSNVAIPECAPLIAAEYARLTGTPR